MQKRMSKKIYDNVTLTKIGVKSAVSICSGINFESQSSEER